LLTAPYYDSQTGQSCLLSRRLPFCRDIFFGKRHRQRQALRPRLVFPVRDVPLLQMQDALHTAGVTFNRCVEELLHFRKCNDFVELFVYLRFSHTEYRAVEINVFPAAEFGMEARPLRAANRHVRDSGYTCCGDVIFESILSNVDLPAPLRRLFRRRHVLNVEVDVSQCQKVPLGVSFGYSVLSSKRCACFLTSCKSSSANEKCFAECTRKVHGSTQAVPLT